MSHSPSNLEGAISPSGSEEPLLQAQTQAETSVITGRFRFADWRSGKEKGDKSRMYSRALLAQDNFIQVMYQRM